MTITAQTSKTGPYNGNGTTTVFSYTFEVQDEAHLVVTLADASGVETVQVLNTDYTVSGVGNANGGQITMSTAPASTYTLTISRNIPITQEVDLENRRSVAPEVLEDAYDKLTQISQDLSEQLGRAIKVSVSQAGGTTDLVGSVSGPALLGFDGADNVITYTLSPSGTVNLAQNVNILDVGNYYTASNVEGVLQEIPLYNQGSAGAATRLLQDRLAEKVSVKDFGAVGDGVAVDTTAIYAAVAAAAGKTLYFPKGTYLTDRIIPEANTFVFLEPGTEIVAISGGTRCFQIQRADVHIWGYGAKTTMDGSQNSHNIYILHPADRCSVRGLWADGSGGGGDDCFYIGGDPANNNVAKNISIVDCKGTNAGRNIVSVVAVHGCLIEGCDLSGAVTNAPRAGIDVEANLFMANGQSAIRQCVIRRNRVYDNTNAGIIVIFGSEVVIEENDVFNNANGGIASNAGGTQFNDTVYRTGDKLGISNFDLATGWITVTNGTPGTDLLTDDLGINVGMWMVKQTASGAVWPANVTQTRYQIVDIDATQSKIRIGQAFGWQELSSFPDSGTGTLSLDPVVSDLGWAVYGREGNSDNIIVRNNFVHDNTGGQGAINTGTSARVLVEGNIVRASTTGIVANYTYDIVVKNNDVLGVGVTTTQRGINVGTSNFVRTDGNTVVNFPLQGINAAGSYGVSLGRDFVRNCGWSSSRAVEVFGLSYGEVRSVCYNDDNHQSSFGIYLNNCTNVVVKDAVARNSGADNATSLASVGTGSGTNIFIDCIQYDGTFKP